MDAPLNGPGEVLQGAIISARVPEHRRGQGEKNTFRGEVSSDEHVMYQETMDASIPIQEGVQKHEPESCGGSGTYWLSCRLGDPHLNHHGHPTAHQLANV